MGRHNADTAAAPVEEPPRRPRGPARYDDHEHEDYGHEHRHGAATPSLPRGRRRVGTAVGIVLLGVILLVFGIIALTTGDEPPEAASKDTAGQDAASQDSTVADQPSTEAPATASDPVTSTQAEQPPVLPVTVLNNSPELTAGLATRVAAALESGGWPIAELLNYDQTQLDESTVFFTPGNAAEEAAAQALVIQFPELAGGAQPRFPGLAGTGLTVAAVGDWLP